MASDSLAVVLRHPQWRLPNVSITSDAFERLADVADRLPADAIDGTILECRLTADDTRVDLAISIGHLPQRAQVFAHAARTAADRDAWTRIVELMRIWPDVFWLEFDLASAPTPDLPLPSVFFRLPFETVDGEKVIAANGPSRAIGTLEYLHGAPLDPQVRATIATALAHVPRGVRIHQIGAMLPRGGDRVRL